MFRPSHRPWTDHFKVILCGSVHINYKAALDAIFAISSCFLLSFGSKRSSPFHDSYEL
jgi:hypothetical protein